MTAIRGALAVVFLLFSCHPLIALADERNFVDFLGNASVMYDSNIFRLPSGVSSLSVLGKDSKSDHITAAGIGLRAVKPYFMQRFEADASINSYHYQVFDHLDYQSVDYAINWQWRYTPDFFGTLKAVRKESLNSYADANRYNVRNLRKDEDRRFDGTFKFDGAWAALVGTGEYNRRNSEAYFQESDHRFRTVNLGAMYVLRSGVSFAFRTKKNKGEYLNRHQETLGAGIGGSRFEETEQEAFSVFPASFKSTFEVRVAHVERNHELTPDRDYSGTAGSFTWNWKTSEKTAVNFVTSRDFASYQTSYSSYTVSMRSLLVPTWQVSEKVWLRGRLEYIGSEFLGTVASGIGVDRVDTVRSQVAEIEWRPLRGIVASTVIKSDRRCSNLADLDYRSQGANVSLRVAF